MSQLIKPTVGRKVWFFPDGNPSTAPWDGNVVKVHSDRTVNVAGFDPNGMPFARISVQLLQEDDPTPPHAHCTWMPYQIGQAARMEQAEQAGRNVLANLGDAASAARKGFHEGNR